MIRLTYKTRSIEADIAGSTVADARSRFCDELGFDSKAAAVLNGVRISPHREAMTFLNNDDTLSFKITHNKIAFLVGSLLLALALTGGVFAYGFTSGSATIGSTLADADFAQVTVNASAAPAWNVTGLYRGSTGGGTLFDVDTLSSGYDGDVVVTVSLANVDKLVKVYRNLILKLEVRDSSGIIIDINEDGVADANDFTFLTMDNASVTMPMRQGTADVYTVSLVSGYYISHVYGAGWSSGTGMPDLYCEVVQR